MPNAPSRRRRAAALLAVTAMGATGLVVTATPAAATPSGLYFSEYVEGTSSNKAIEIENPTDSPIDLSRYSVAVFSNGKTTGTSIALAGTVPAGGVFVLANPQAVLPQKPNQTSGSLSFNGDDAVELLNGTTLIDSIGQVGTDPGDFWGTGTVTTLDHTLRRIASTAPDTDPSDAYDPSTQWNGFATDDFTGLGLPDDQTRTPTPPPVVHIGDVQGEVTDDDNGATFQSPLKGQTVTIRGVVTELAEWETGQNRTATYGFFLQEPANATDGNAKTSDGVFVFEGTGYADFKNSAGGYFTPQVGDDLTITAKVSEYYDFTEMGSAELVSDNGAVPDLDAAVPALTADPPTDVADAARYWERHEGERASLPTGSIAVSGRHVYASSDDAEAYFITPHAPVADRADPYARRVFRDPHLLDDIPNQLFDDGNGYRILVGSIGVKATAGVKATLIAPVRTFDTLTAPAVGGVYFDFGEYSIQPAQQPALADGPDPSESNPPAAPNRNDEFSVAQFNLENLYDFRDDPTDGCDFLGNPGCPGVSPPFDYTPADEATYDQRLDGEATQIINALHAPDLLTVEEAEAQDICKVDAGQLVCDLVNGTADSDGKPDTLQELALHIAALGGPTYDAAYDPDGADARGIVSGFLYRADRVQLLPASSNDPVLGANPAVQYRGAALAYNSDVSNPKALNAMLPADVDRSTGVDGNNVFTRAATVGHFRLWRNGIGTSVFRDIYAIANHFSSTPEQRVGQRTEQAAYNAAIVNALAPTGEPVLIGGDLNTFPRPDDPLGPTGQSDQLGALYNAGLRDLYDDVLADAPADAYSYVYGGQAQTLDHIFVTPALHDDLVQARYAHINADWPQDTLDGAPHATSDHDPLVGRFGLDVSVEGLQALVQYYADNGDMTARAAALLDARLAAAERYRDRGWRVFYATELTAFALQAGILRGHGIAKPSADSLIREDLRLLRSLG